MSRRAALALVLIAGALALPRAARAHDFTPGVLALEEGAPGSFALAWTAPVDSTGDTEVVDVAFPDHCRPGGARLECGAAGLHGSIHFPGLRRARSKVIAVVRWQDGDVLEALVTADAPALAVERRPGSSARLWLGLGAEHILLGADHLAFVVGLLLVLGLRDRRRLLATITAFTVAHSITLALAALDVVRLSSAPVEALIAASVLLVAREALHDRPTVTRRTPWIVAAIFGLVHGLGFAGALAELGLPRDATLSSLLWFNLGVELGQLAVVAAIAALVHLVRRWHPQLAGVRLASCYALGSIAAFWLLDRLAAI